ncbi:MAG: cation:proton antiporter [Candidatus Paceibacterota bacterium]|jgi:Kef-type K+ transport system membrane component KefB/Trk K+ transport system NAD-binding subunit
MTGTVFDLAIVVLIAAGLGVIAKMLKQPTILAYLATGMLIGAVGSLALKDSETFRVFSELGVMLLLFLVGLEINYSSLRLVGKISLITGLGQIIITAQIGYMLAQVFGFSMATAAYVAIALTFSSTIIVVKILSDKKELNSLYGKISVGMLLVQDFIAILLLVLLAGGGENQTISWGTISIAVLEGVFLFGLMLFLGRRVLPFIFEKVARSSELLFLVSLAWVFLVATIVSQIGFSIEIAGFLAGIALANSSEHHQIAARIRPLRDFFLIAFFVTLGASMVFSHFSGLLVPILVFSFFVLIIKPLIVLLIMSVMGYRKRTSFLSGITMGQVSEFSLVLMALGLKVGHVNEGAVALVTAVGVITIALSSYMIQFSDVLFRFLSRGLSLFERKRNIEHSIEMKDVHMPIILIGFHRLGESIAMGLPREKLLVIEFDPEVVKKLKRNGYAHIFGDFDDPEIVEESHMVDAELVISTSPDVEDNLALLKEFRRKVKKPRMVVRAETELDAEALYAAGADYVLFPHLTSGQYFGKTIAIDPEMKILNQLKEKDLQLLKTIKTYGEHQTF